MWATEWHGSTREWAADMGDILLEVIATDVEDARMAAEGGADRLEVCAGMDRDGTTPDLATITAICDAGLPLDVMAMVRPRGGDFTYTPAELRAMTDAIDSFRHAGVDGVVVGCLNAAGTVDAEALSQLTEAANGLSVTFHRAFDCAPDASAAMTALRASGVGRVLTLGYPVGAPRQPTDVARVTNAIREASHEVTVMTGGLLAADAPSLLRAAGVREFHLGRAVRHAESYDHPIDPTRVREWRALLQTR